MLKHEIMPFADAHIDALKTIIEQMEGYLLNFQDLSPEKVEDWRRALHVSINGFTRFGLCMADEVDQKEKLEKRLKDRK